MSSTKDPLKKLTHVRMSKGSHHATSKKDSSEKPQIKDTEEHKKSSQAAPEVQEVKTPDQSLQHNENRRLPQFLSKFGLPQDGERSFAKEEIANRALAVIEEKAKENPNSFGSIFTREHEEISGIKRVFKKSIAFLVINLMLFGILALSSINLLSVPFLFTGVISVFYIVSACLFFIIVADRSYLWLSIAGQILLLLLVHSFLGQGFDLITIIISLFAAVLIFSAYSELEKIQLGSRLFFISHITSESIRILTTVVILIISLGLFNSMVSAGTENYLEENVLSSELIVDTVLIGDNPNVSLNRLLLTGNALFAEDNTEYTFRDFLTFNYRGGTSVLTQEEANDIIIACQARGNSTSTSCNQEVNDVEDERLEEWRKEAYPKLSYDFDRVLNQEDYRRVVQQHYIYLANDFSQYDSGFAIIPTSYVVPAFFAIVLFALLLIIKPVLGWLAYVTTWLVWKILRWIGFARIEVEAVEAEIVSI
jgi:hypothetical protein